MQLNERLMRQLEEIASKQQRDVDEVLEEAVERYIETQTDDEAFDQMIDKLMEENAWLLDELAKR